MAFQHDAKYAAEIGNVFGEYLTTFTSEPKGEIHAYIFRKKTRVNGHVVLPKWVRASEVTESYVSELREYARREGFADRFHLIYSEG